jgi:ubiquinone/menaquinone biosynthesis C-methylase UbiE
MSVVVEQTTKPTILDTICRSYQSLFPANYPEQAKLVELSSTQRQDEFLIEYFEHEYRKGQKIVDRFSAITTDWHGGRTLDFGCGGGGLTYQLAKVSRECVGIDLEQYKLNFGAAQANRLNIHNVSFNCYPGGKLPFDTASFDSIVCVDVMEHLPTPEEFVLEFQRVLKPGGRLLVSFGPPWYHAHGKHMWTKLPGWWTHLLFPRRVVMRVAGIPEHLTWEDLGIMRLSVAKFHRSMRASQLKTLHLQENIKSVLKPLKWFPGVRELFVSEVIGVFQKPL